MNSADTDNRKKQIILFHKKNGRLPNRSGKYSEKKLNEALTRYCSPNGTMFDRKFDKWARSKGYGRDTVAENIKAIWAWSKKHKKRPTESSKSDPDEKRLAMVLSSYVNPKKSTYRKSFAIEYDAKFPRRIGGNFLDLKGLTFNRLTPTKVVGYTPKGGYIWECECSCGEKTTAPASKIKSGERKSCGCISKEYLKPGNNKIELAGTKTKYFSVLEQTGEQNEQGGVNWSARCRCGNLVVLTTNQLTAGTVKSCGCIRKENQFRTIENRAFSAQRAGARHRNYKWFLTKEEYLEIAKRPCSYCGKMSLRANKNTSATMELNSVDRKNNEAYYKVNNCQPVCFRCQELKSDYTHENFVSHYTELANFKALKDDGDNG